MRSAGIWMMMLWCLPCVQSLAQTINTEQLSSISEQLHQQYSVSRQRVQQYINRESIPQMFSTANGTRVLITGVRSDGTPEYRITLNAGAAQSTGAASLHQSLNTGVKLEGKGITIALWDAGLVKPHAEFDVRLSSNEGPSPDNHATHVTGTLIASGVNGSASGMAPKAQAATYFFANDLAVVAGLAATQLISNHSYGAATGWFNAGTHWVWTGHPDISNIEDFRFGFYGARAATLDEIAFNAPYYSIFWATGNDRSDVGDGTKPADCNAGTGYDCIIPDGVAKNIFTIGAVNKVPLYSSPVSVVMGNYSSWGPTDDGRIKPDLVAPGTDIFSTSATGNNMYEIMSGTSMATPAVSGSLALLQELYGRLHGGRFMKSATLKALAIHTARETGPLPGPDYSFGWGLIDVVAGAKLLVTKGTAGTHVEELSIANGDTWEMPIQVVPGKKVTATIAWTDPPAIPVANALDPSSLMLVNDLDLRVGNSAADQSPWTLDPLNPSRQATRGDNFRDNVEKIEFVSSTASYVVRVSHKGALVNGVQNFSLVLTYESPASELTYYWIGNSGDWNDNSHWSLSSGGSPAGMLPSTGDRVIIDDNSITDANAVINLVSHTEVNQLLWLAASGKLGLNNHALVVGKTATVSANHNVMMDGVLQLKGELGTVSFQGTGFHDVTIEVADGVWMWSGGGNVDEIRVVGGELHLDTDNLEINRLVSTPNAAVKIVPNISRIVIRERTTIDGLKTAFESNKAQLVFRNNVDVVWDNVSWTGGLLIENGKTTISGENEIGTATIIGDLAVQASTRIDLLDLRDGSTFEISNTVVSMDSLSVQSSAQHPVTIRGHGVASITLNKSRKYCFDHLDISGVALAGNAVVASGVNSVLTNATGWFSGTCTDALFSDFEVHYPCVDGMTELIDKSSGAPTAWSWSASVPDLNFDSDRQHPHLSVPHPGQWDFRLRATKGSSVHSTTKTIDVRPNPMPEFEIVQNGTRLFSGQAGQTYQWYLNDERLEGQTERSLNFEGEEGIYTVVARNGFCNRLSLPFVITEVSQRRPDAVVYPNPAFHSLHFTYPLESVCLINVLGVEMCRKINSSGSIDVSDLPPGVYVVKMIVEGRPLSQRVLIVR